MTGSMADLRSACRGLWVRWPSSFAWILVCALGIGLSTAMFALTDPFVLRPLPFAAPEELVVVEVALTRESFAARMDARDDPLAPTLEDWQRRTDLFTGLAAVSQTSITVRDSGHSIGLSIVMVTPEFFRVLGVPAPPVTWELIVTGRETELPVLLTTWARKRLLPESMMVGTALNRDDGGRIRVVGVLPDSVTVFPERSGRWEALSVFQADRIVPKQGCCILKVLARVSPGVTLERVRQSLARPLSSGRRLDLRVEWLSEDMRAGVGGLARGALAAALFVLMICAANAANLLGVGSLYRAREFETRRALGASPWMLGRLRLLEAAVPTVIAVGAGIGLASLVLVGAAHAMPTEYGALGDPHITARSAIFAVAAGAVVMAIAAIPGIALLRGSRENRTGTGGRPSARLRIALTGLQVAVAMVATVCSGMLVQSYWKLFRQDTGYLANAFDIPVIYPMGLDPGSLAADVDLSTERLAKLDYIRAAGAIAGSIAGEAESKRSMTIRGQRYFEDTYYVTSGFFDASGMKLRAGRVLVPGDREPIAVVVNEAFANLHFSSTAAIGAVLTMAGNPSRQATIVGVVQNALARGLAKATTPTVYAPLRLFDSTQSVRYLLRTSEDRKPDLTTVRGVITAVNNRAVVGSIDTIASRLGEGVRERTFATLVLVLFAGAGGAVCAAGLVAMVGFVVARRLRETAIRIALGASRRSVVALVAYEALTAAVLGGGAGLLVGRWLSTSLRRFVFGIEAGNWLTASAAFAVGIGLLLAAALVPASRAARVEPAQALRAD